VSRKGPILVGAGALALVLLCVFFLVLPKMREVSEARMELDEARAEQQTLESQLAALRDAEAGAAEAERTIQRVERLIPPTIDVQSAILLLDNAAAQSSIALRTFTPSTPAFDPATGLTTMSIQATLQGTYFALDEFLYRVETLPRAAQVRSVSIGSAEAATGGTTTSSLQLTMTATIHVYTSDASAGPGSSPGPTEPTGGG
jgi:Tfp pilus assembly protein PilO